MSKTAKNEKEKKYEMKEKKYIGKLDLNGYHVILLERPNEVIEIKVSLKKKKEMTRDE